MKKYKYLLQSTVALMAMCFGFVHQASAQCNITYSGNLCVGEKITFTGVQAGTTQNWDFNGQGSTTGNWTTDFVFPNAGSKTITYITNISGQPCTATLVLVIKTKPVIKLKLKSVYTQCFKDNLFCFEDSSYNPNGSAIDEVRYITEDGQSFTFTKPTMPNTFCFSIIDARGGKFYLDVFVTDANGCQTSIRIADAVEVRAKIGPNFISNSPSACDSVTATVTNVSTIPQNQVKKITWIWGDGTITYLWGPTLKHTYYKPGVYRAKIIIETLDGCIDSFQPVSQITAAVYVSKTVIIADRDSACLSDSKIIFGVNPLPFGAQAFLWNFGDPPSGQLNTNKVSWGPSHTFTGMGPYQIKLTYQANCGGTIQNMTVYDTILIIGPSSTIEIPFNRIPEYQVFQCPKYNMIPVQTKNFSTFYHNDDNMNDDDSTYKEADSSMGHVFRPTQASQSSLPNIRLMSKCVIRLWEFGDGYSPKCTTNTKQNYNANVNCNYSHDSLPFHSYKSWERVMLEDFKNTPMQDAIFIESSRLCKKLNVWPSTSFFIIDDSMITVPLSYADTSLASSSQYAGLKTKNFLREKGVTGPGYRYIDGDVDIDLASGDTVWVGDEFGLNMIPQYGPQTLRLKNKNTIRLTQGNDVTFLFTVYIKRDTLPLPFLSLRQANGENPVVVGFYSKTPPGTAGFDYTISYQRFRDLFFARIPSCNNIRLKHEDTCHPMLCTSEAIKQVTMMHANAGGVGSGLLKTSIECLGGKNPQYGITFILTDLKPGCTFSDVQINYDSFCGTNNWVSLSTGLVPGNRPPGLPYMGYQIASNPPSRYSKQYSASNVCDKSGCITVGIIVGNGVSQSGVKPLCADTQWYRKFACFPMIDPAFEIINIKPNLNGVRKICRKDDVVFRPIAANLTRTDDLKSLRWELATGNASPYYSRSWRRFIQEDYYRNQRIKSMNGVALDTNNIYNYIVQTRGGEDPYQVPCTNIWEDGQTQYFGKPDTLLTAAISKWDTVADVSEVWDNIKERAEARGFDPFSLSGAQLAKMIWNNVGTIGNVASGAKGCIDTAGFGRYIKFLLVPRDGYKTIFHERDTNIVPLDSFFQGGKWVKAYTIKTQWAGYHLMSISMTSSNGKCDEFAAFPVIVGFAMDIEYDDSIICQDQANSLQARPVYKMFHPDPLNFGTWDNYDYWRDQQRLIDKINGVKNREPFTKWDWSMADDDINDPNTIFGGGDYGASGPGTPFKQLGGGGIYYKSDSGVYTWRNVAGDSTGCMDTITKRLFVTRLDVNFGLTMDLKDCKSIINFQDSAILHDPCKWALKDCNNTGNMMCDFITKWDINWGDGGKTNLFTRTKASQPGLIPNLSHKYTRRGWFKVEYTITTDQGCADTFSRWLFIPGPRPKFEFTTKGGNETTICVGESIDFTNLTDSASPNASWIWYYGDNDFLSTTSDSAVVHQYNKTGRFYVFLQQFDKVILPPSINEVCPATYPDTPNQQAFIVNVLPRDTIRGSVLKSIICKGDSNTFMDNSDTIFKSYKWTFIHDATQIQDTVTVTTKSYSRTFDRTGSWTVLLTASYDPSHPHPWCTSPDVILKFTVDTIKADFTIDSSGKPKFCFTNKTAPDGTTYRWGYFHNGDIKITGDPFLQNDVKTNKDVVCVNYDSVGVYWICLVAENSLGCIDTICKPVLNDFIRQLFIANVFTPGNADGLNDEFRVPVRGHETFALKIFNRWGEKVYFSEDPTKGWNGKVNNVGADVPDGTYFYQLFIKFKGEDDKPKVISGSVNVIRK